MSTAQHEPHAPTPRHIVPLPDAPASAGGALLDLSAFFRLLDETARTHGSYVVLRATVRDVGEDELRGAIVDEPACRGVSCDLGERGYAILVRATTREAVNALASRLAARTAAAAARRGLLGVQTIAAGALWNRVGLDPVAVLAAADVAVHNLRASALRAARRVPC